MTRSTPRDVMIFDALRTPRGKAREGGGLAKIAPAELVKQLVAALATRHGPQIRAADHLILGCVGQTGAQGGHIALMAKLHSGLAPDTAAWSLNNFCASGLSAIVAGVDKIGAGNAELVLAGGVESMSHVPYLADQGAFYTDPQWAAALRYVPVAVSADALAQREKITRQELDAVAAASHGRAAAAQAENLGQQSMIAVREPSGAVALGHDEYMRKSVTAEGLAAFPAAFGALGTTYSATLKAALGIETLAPLHAVVHAPGMADGAGLALLGTRESGARLGLKPRARVIAYSEIGGDPVLALTAGCAAMDRALTAARMSLDDIAVIEYMEAFAVVPALFRRDYPRHADKVNIHGGHIARGHALGATGAILTSSLLDAMEQSGAGVGLVVAFAASGIGAALIVERA